MPTASWSKGFHSTLSGKCARTLDLKVLRKGLCSKFSPESETKKEKSKKENKTVSKFPGVDGEAEEQSDQKQV